MCRGREKLLHASSALAHTWFTSQGRKRLHSLLLSLSDNTVTISRSLKCCAFFINLYVANLDDNSDSRYKPARNNIDADLIKKKNTEKKNYNNLMIRNHQLSFLKRILGRFNDLVYWAVCCL